MTRKLFLLFTIHCLLFTVSHADTLRLNDGSELKGIVVEDYKDRVVLSTPDGELTVMKSEVRELYYDSEEENLIKLAEQAKERRDYGRAFGYYNMAYKKNPNSKAAKDGFVFLQGYLFRQEEKRKVDDIKKREDFERGLGAVESEKAAETSAMTPIRRLKDAVGINLAEDNNMPRIESVRNNSPADEAGIKKGDLLIAIWGRLTGYMSIDDIINILLDKPSLEIKCTIQRTVALDPDGAAFGIDIDGMKVSGLKDGTPASRGGLKKDDLIIAIDDKPTRYMPLKKAVASMKRAGSVRITVNRELLIWRKD